METIIVIFIVSFAVAYVGRSLYKQFTGKSSCSSGCDACSTSHPSECDPLPKTFKFDRTPEG